MDLEFGNYRLKRAERLLLGPKGPMELSTRSFDILATLLERPDEVIGKTELFDAVWPGVVVEENTLQVHISALRKLLPAEMIVTVHGRGYKYAGPRPFGAAAEASSPHRPSIAVLPFDNMSGDPEQDYFSNGITEDIIAELGKFREFLVIARNSSFQFRGKANDVADVAKKLGVQYVVEGSVRKIGNRVRVTVQLIHASSTAHIWGEHYDRELDDIFAIQDEITQMIAARLARQARTAIASRARARPTDNMSAYELYLRALQLAAVYDTVLEAEPFLRQAVKLEPLDVCAPLAMIVHCIYRTGKYRSNQIMKSKLLGLALFAGGALFGQISIHIGPPPPQGLRRHAAALRRTGPRCAAARDAVGRLRFLGPVRRVRAAEGTAAVPAGGLSGPA